MRILLQSFHSMNSVHSGGWQGYERAEPEVVGVYKGQVVSIKHIDSPTIVLSREHHMQLKIVSSL